MRTGPRRLLHQRSDAQSLENEARADRQLIVVAAPSGYPGDRTIHLVALHAREIGTGEQADLARDGSRTAQTARPLCATSVATRLSADCSSRARRRSSSARLEELPIALKGARARRSQLHPSQAARTEVATRQSSGHRSCSADRARRSLASCTPAKSSTMEDRAGNAQQPGGDRTSSRSRRPRFRAPRAGALTVALRPRTRARRRRCAASPPRSPRRCARRCRLVARHPRAASRSRVCTTLMPCTIVRTAAQLLGGHR